MNNLKPNASEAMDPLIVTATILLMIMFGASAVAGKYILTGFGEYTAAGMRFLLASVVIFLWAKITKKKLKISSQQLFEMTFFALILFVQIGLFNHGLKHTPASRAILIVNLQPFFVLILAHIFIKGDSLNIKKVIGVILGFSGLVFVLSNGNIAGLLNGIKITDLYILINTVLWAIAAIFIKRVIHKYESYQIVFYQNIITVPLFFIAGFLFDESMFGSVTKYHVITMIYYGIITTAFGFIMMNKLLAKYKATIVHSFVFIMPVSGIIISWLLLNEHISKNLLISLVLIISGILLVNHEAKRSAPLTPK